MEKFRDEEFYITSLKEMDPKTKFLIPVPLIFTLCRNDFFGSEYFTFTKRTKRDKNAAIRLITGYLSRK